jgi:hypothetical protein
MRCQRNVASIAAAAALACAGVACAEGTEEGSVLRPTYFQEATTAPAEQPTSTAKPLMMLLDRTPAGEWLDRANITIGGYVDGGYTLSGNGQRANIPLSGRVFDTKSSRWVLDQVDLFVDRPVDYGKVAQNHSFDIGGHVEIDYGWDLGILHSSGLFDNPATLGVAHGTYRSRVSPENQFDLLQAYLDVALPVGSGLRLRAGKFVTTLGYEVINPTQNAFYSHSYLFGFAIPFTQTGVTGEYKINDDWLVDGGITRGWNQTFKDNNGDPDFLGTLTYTPQESDELKKWKFIANLSEGPQGTHDDSNWWTVVDLQAIYSVTTDLTLAANADYGDAPARARAGGTDQWYGIAGYAALALNEYFTTNLRLEYYGDSHGLTLGANRDENLFEATLNLAIKPFAGDAIGQNLMIRPEVRYDDSTAKFFKAGKHRDQFTVGVDAYFTF